MEQPKIDAVRDYFQQSFSGAGIRSEQDTERGTVKFTIEYGREVHSVTLAKDFFSSFDKGQVVEKLKQFLLIEHLQEMPNARLIVTLNGLESEYQI